MPTPQEFFTLRIRIDHSLTLTELLADGGYDRSQACTEQFKLPERSKTKSEVTLGFFRPGRNIKPAAAEVMRDELGLLPVALDEFLSIPVNYPAITEVHSEIACVDTIHPDGNGLPCILLLLGSMAVKNGKSESHLVSHPRTYVLESCAWFVGKVK